MRRRSYEYYEIVSGLTGVAHSVHYRGNLIGAERKLDEMSATVDDNNGNLYLVHCQLIEARKADKK